MNVELSLFLSEAFLFPWRKTIKPQCPLRFYFRSFKGREVNAHCHLVLQDLELNLELPQIPNTVLSTSSFPSPGWNTTYHFVPKCFVLFKFTAFLSFKFENSTNMMTRNSK
jgi:hypothetical protein